MGIALVYQPTLSIVFLVFRLRCSLYYWIHWLVLLVSLSYASGGLQGFEVIGSSPMLLLVMQRLFWFAILCSPSKLLRLSAWACIEVTIEIPAIVNAASIDTMIALCVVWFIFSLTSRDSDIIDLRIILILRSVIAFN